MLINSPAAPGLTAAARGRRRPEAADGGLREEAAARGRRRAEGGGEPREATSPPAEDLGRGDSLASRRGNGSGTMLHRPDGTEASGGYVQKEQVRWGCEAGA